MRRGGKETYYVFEKSRHILWKISPGNSGEESSEFEYLCPRNILLLTEITVQCFEITGPENMQE